MRRLGLVLTLLALAARAEPTVHLVDGRALAAELLSSDADSALFRVGPSEWRAPLRNVVAIEWEPLAPAPDAFHLFLGNGDRLKGNVSGAGTTVSLEAPGLRGIARPLSEVHAVRFGKLLGGTQVPYDEAFARMLRGGKSQVLVQRETRPFPVSGRVVEIGEATMKVLLAGATHEIETRLVYGFVLEPEEGGAAPPAEGVQARLLFRNGGRLTLPAATIDAERIAAGSVSVARSEVSRIEFAGAHLAHLSDFDPVDEKGTALFGPAPKAVRDGMVHGGPLRLRGAIHARGLGVHAHSRLEYALNRRFGRLFLRCGIDDAAGPEGDATFRVLGDGRPLAEARRRRSEPPAELLVDVTGVERLVLETDPGESYTSDFCDWAEARVFTPEPMDPPPGGSR